MNNYKLTIQYDGSRYKGWQRLGKGENTIQAKIENVLSTLVGRKIEIIGCSRTDAGVHALEQIANFKVGENFKESEIKNHLNKSLPQDISITRVELVSDRFHARYNALDKTYLYKIWNKEYSHPFIRKYSMHVEQQLNMTSMKRASQYFVGEHDFTAFSNAKSKKKSMVRKITSIEIKEDSGLIQIRIEGNGFLHNMVRKIVGMLIEVGLGKRLPEDVREIIELKERQVGLMADARGLYLEKIKY